MEEFFGRFHPLLVHLPIGFLILAVIFELLNIKRETGDDYRKPVIIILVLSLASGLAALSTGWLLSESVAYPPKTLFIHRWLAIIVLALAFIWIMLKWKLRSPKVHFAVAMGTLILVSVTGHYGGILTHGENYLTDSSPAWIRDMFTSDRSDSELAIHTDSVKIYPQLIRPVLEKKCVTCHNNEDTYGGFNATQLQHLFEEGETGVPVVPGNLKKSEIFQRVTYPTGDKKFMPPTGNPLTYTELKILEYWIHNGADSMLGFSTENMSSELISLIRRDYNLNYEPRPYFEKIKMDSLNETDLENLRANGFEVRLLGEDNAFVEIEFLRDTLSAQALTNILNIADHVLNLNLSDSFIEEHIPIAQFTNLNRLELKGSHVVSGQLFDGFGELIYLNSLNLYGSNINMEMLRNALKAPNLQTVYLWQTSLDPSEIELIKSEYPGIEFDTGFTFSAVSN
ncbi:MAG: hypothetical protein P8X57_05790 [Cyclobacteriaceae bacterium]